MAAASISNLCPARVRRSQFGGLCLNPTLLLLDRERFKPAMTEVGAVTGPKTIQADAPRQVTRMVVLVVIAAGVAAAAYSVGSALVTRSLREDATTTALAWRSHFSSDIGSLETFGNNGQLTPQQKDFITATAKVGRILRFRLFDSRGRLVLESDKAGVLPVSIALRDHDAGAVRAIEFQRMIVEVFQNNSVQGAPFDYAEAHVPLLAPDGEVLGLIEIHIDQSRMASLFRQALQGFALALALLIAAIVLGLSFLTSLRHRSAEFALGNLPEDRASKPTATVKAEELPLQPVVRIGTTAAESFDDCLVRVTEDAAQGIPERIAFECHLGLGDAAMPFGTKQLERFVTDLVAESAAILSSSSEDAGNGVVLMPRILVSTKFADRGIEVRISDNRLQSYLDESSSLTGLRELSHHHGGGVDVHVTPGSGATIIVWWPNPFQQARAA